ncbi:MAG TPA: hypothetical protein VIL78_21895 [Hanamia sp.]
MKKMKFPLIALLVAGLLTIAFIGCKKELKSPGVTSDVAPTPAFDFTLPTFGTACVTDGSYCFDASFTTHGGPAPGGNNSITVTITQGGLPVDGQDQQVVNGTSGNFCFTDLAAGQYTVLVYFRHAANDNAQPINVPLSFTLTIQTAANCSSSECTPDGVTLTRSLSNVVTDINGMVTSLQTNYIVTNCGGLDLTKLKLQGGLIHNASIISTSYAGTATNINYKLKTTNGNNVLTWTFNLPAGTSETFSVNYSVWGVNCGSPLSGAWSLKNSAGIPIGVSPDDESANEAGYLDRLYWNCP